MTLILKDLFTEEQLKMFDRFISDYQQKQKEKHTYIYENDNIYGIIDTHGKEFENIEKMLYDNILTFLETYIFTDPYVPILEDDDGNLWEIVGYSPDIYFGIYDKGHKCEIHSDDSNPIFDDELDTTTYEIFTCLLYISTQFYSGQTVIYHEDGYTDMITPKRGQCILFNHTLEHESALLEENTQKRWISIVLRVAKVQKNKKRKT